MVERILHAATRVLIRKGYHAASTNAIAREARISPGSLYQYFANKDEVVDEISVRLAENIWDDMDPALRDSIGLPADQALHRVLEAALDSLLREADVLRALVDHLPAEKHRNNLRMLRARLAEQVHAILRFRFELEPEAERRTWMIVELCQNLLIRYVLDRPPFEPRNFIEDLSMTVLKLTEPPQRESQC